MSAALGALTIAIATEFSVILSARFHEERGAGRGLTEALQAAYARTGAAVLASGLTATAGFAVLIASDIRMLRDFGLVTVIDLAVALIGVMVALPAVLASPGRIDEGPLLACRRPHLLRRSSSIAILHGAGDGNGTLGLDNQPPALAAARVRRAAGDRDLEGDANVAQDDCETSQLPCPPDARRTPACRVHLGARSAVCDLFDRPSVISFWFSTGADCVEQQDVVSQVFERYRGRVGFLSRGLARRPRYRSATWSGSAAGRCRSATTATALWRALYRVGVCPTFAYAFPGGTLWRAGIGELTAAQLSDRIEMLLRATRAAEAEGRS